jgi:hypothetical protein
MGSKTRGAVFGVLVAFAGLTGCAAVGSAERGDATDARGTAALRDSGPRFVVAGPTRLLHVDIHGRPALLYTVARRTGTQVDCDGPGIGSRSLIHGDRRTILDLDVSADQVACLQAVDSNAPRAGSPIEVSWHARSGNKGAIAEVVASNR